MIQIKDSRMARAHLMQFRVRLASFTGLVWFVICMVVGLLILLVQPHSLGNSALGALITGGSAFIGNWIGFLVSDRFPP